MLLSFIVCVLYLSCEKNENNQKEAGFGPFKKEGTGKKVKRVGSHSSVDSSAPIHPAVPSSNPKHTIYTFCTNIKILHYICYCVEKWTKVDKKRPGLAHI